MTTSTEALSARITTLLSEIYGGQSWIVTGDVLAALISRVEHLEALNATSVLCIAGSPGTGDLPDSEFSPDSIILGIEGKTMMDSIRAVSHAMQHLDEEVLERIERFDPTREARALGVMFDEGHPIAGRSKFGARPKAWQALEDKTTIDRFWDVLGVKRAPSVTLSIHDVTEIERESERLDRGMGVAWVADNRDGFHGGGSFLRWVRDEAERKEALAFFRPACDSIRIMLVSRGDLHARSTASSSRMMWQPFAPAR